MPAANGPTPAPKLRFTDVDGYRITAFETNTPKGQLADLELRHRRHARAEDRIRIAKDTGLTNLPLHGFDQNKIWCHLVLMGMELTAWTQLLAFVGHAERRWEPKRLRHRVFTIPASLARRAPRPPAPEEGRPLRPARPHRRHHPAGLAPP